LDHPLVLEDQMDLRRRVIQLLTSSYNVRRSSSIVFVCGGNEDLHMRMRFRSFCEKHLKNFDIFLPESAMENLFGDEVDEPFDIADFEELIGQLSQAIVIFPEAAGSYAETGYFSAIESLSKRSILVLDSRFQGDGSFIAWGPAKKIGAKSIFHAPIQMDYKNPDFSKISEVIKKAGTKKYLKSLMLKSFKDLTPFELFCLLHEITGLLSIVTVADLEFILRGIFKGHISVPKVRKVVSILVGSKYLCQVGPYGHVTTNKARKPLLEIRDGQKNVRDEIRLKLANLYQAYGAEFTKLVEVSQDAG
jgi:hypothetical protein